MQQEIQSEVQSACPYADPPLGGAVESSLPIPAAAHVLEVTPGSAVTQCGTPPAADQPPLACASNPTVAN